MSNAKKIQAVARDVRGYLNWLQEEGVDFWRAPERAEITPEAAPSTLEMIRAELGDCQRCKLAPLRTNLVFGVGDPSAELMFVGEGPGADEDAQGEPFVGKAGQLLTKMISAMGLSREQVYIANIIKCRPPMNRNPEPDEIAACRPFLDKQIAAIRPKVICALGKFAAQTLLNTPRRISELRGKFHDLNGVKVLPTFHPAYLLRNPAEKKRVWEDLQVIMSELNLPLPGRS
ncbi:MAG: uracil-DNA glycosylase [Nitrospiria bacterium]